MVIAKVNREGSLEVIKLPLKSMTSILSLKLSHAWKGKMMF